MIQRRKKKNSVDFSFDSLADIVSNILGIMVLLGVMVGLTSKSAEQEQKDEEQKEREEVLGKMDAMTDVIFKDNRLSMPLERDARYNRFHVHFIVKDNRIYFIDLSELNYELQQQGGDINKLNGKIFGDSKLEIDNRILLFSDTAWFQTDDKNGSVVDKATSKEALRKIFRLEKRTEEKSERFLSQLSPNNHAIHFHVFPSGVEAFNIANAYLRMLGFDTGYELLPENEKGKVKLPLNLQDSSKKRYKFLIQ